MEPNELDKTLKRLMGNPRPVDAERLAAQVMLAIRAESEKASAWKRWFRPFDFLSRTGSRRLAIGLTFAIVFIGLIAIVVRFNSEGTKPVQSLAAEAPNYGPPVPRTPAADALLARTDVESSLLSYQWQLVESDLLLRPHSIWDQRPASKI